MPTDCCHYNKTNMTPGNGDFNCKCYMGHDIALPYHLRARVINTELPDRSPTNLRAARGLPALTVDTNIPRLPSYGDMQQFLGFV